MAGWRQDTEAASSAQSGGGKSGSPAPKPMTGLPAALSALAFASTASVADSAIDPMRRETRRRAGEGAAGSEGETAVMRPSCRRTGGAGPSVPDGPTATAQHHVRD